MHCVCTGRGGRCGHRCIQGTRLRSSGHLVSGKCQTQEYGAVMWPGKEKTGLTVEMLFSAGKH